MDSSKSIDDPEQKITLSETASNSDFCFGIEALGALHREQSSDASTFTLSLPARRSKFLLAQAIVAFGEALFLGFMPARLLPALSTLIGQTFFLGQALCYAVLLPHLGIRMVRYPIRLALHECEITAA